MIIPTVGRKVWYRPNETELHARGSMAVPRIEVIPGEPLDGTIVAVFDNRLVNLAVFDVFGNHHRRINVILKQDDDVMVEGDAYAEWMPYQVQSAQKDGAKTSKKDVP